MPYAGNNRQFVPFALLLKFFPKTLAEKCTVT